MKKILLLIILLLSVVFLYGCKKETIVEYAVEGEVVSVVSQREHTNLTFWRYHYTTVITIRYNNKDYVYEWSHSTTLNPGDMTTIYVTEEDMIPIEPLYILGEEDVFLVTVAERRDAEDGWEYKVVMFGETEIIDYWFFSELLFSIDEHILAIEYDDLEVVFYDFDN